MQLGCFIKRYRENNGMTLRDFASRCGTSHSYIAMLENGKNSKTGEPIVPTIAMLKKISFGLGMSLNDLITVCDDMPVSLAEETIDLQLFGEKEPSPISEPKLTEEEKEWIAFGNRLSSDVKKLLMSALDEADKLSPEQSQLAFDLIRVALKNRK